MSKIRTCSWHDATIALMYPSVLGAILFYFLDTAVKFGAIPLFNIAFTDGQKSPRASSAEAPFLAELYLHRAFTIGVFTVLTSMVVIHFSADFLYSKYSKNTYTFANFALDTLIALLIALSYISLSTFSRLGIPQIRAGFLVFWLSLFFVYALFLCWDVRAYQSFADKRERLARFYFGMIWPFEACALVSWVTLAAGALILGQQAWYDYTYLSIGLVALGVFSVWLWKKMLLLESGLPSGEQAAGQPSAGQLGIVCAIRSARRNDLVACGRILSQVYRQTYGEVWTPEVATARLAEIYSIGKEYCLVLEDSNRVVGFIFARPFRWNDGTRLWVEEVVLEEEYRGQSWGKLMIRSLCRIARLSGMVGLSLLAKEQSYAQEWYRGLGYRKSPWAHMELNISQLMDDGPDK